MRRSAVAISLLLVMLATTGCETILANYWDDVRKSDPPAEEGEGAEPHAHFLGVRVSEDVGPFQIGVKIVHVFGASPAARVGLEPGDELRSLDGTPVRTPSEVKAALLGRNGSDHTETVPIVYWRDGQEYRSTIDLVTLRTYLAARRKRLFEEAGYSASEFPFFFRYETRSVEPAFLALYYGVDVPESVQVFYDLTLFPLAPGIAVFRREWLALVDSSRTQIWHWPLRVTTPADDRTLDLKDIVPARPERTVDL